MSLIIILVGIPGSGKSTVLQETVKLFPQLEVINYGDMMLKEASLQHIDKDSLRRLPLPQQQRIGVEAAKKMASQMPQIACIDTHAMINSPYATWRVFRLKPKLPRLNDRKRGSIEQIQPLFRSFNPGALAQSKYTPCCVR